MLYIQKILKKLFQQFNKTEPNSDTKISDKTEIKETNYIGHINFSLTEHGEIDIVCKIPETTNLDTDQLTNLSEQFAKFLYHINDGYLIDDIFSILKNFDHIKNHNEKDKLFLDNILFFWALLHVENNKKKYQKSKANQPIVRPSEVFKFG
jgi:hypothetical protein